MRRLSHLWRCVLCEFICTMFLIFFGTSTAGQMTLSKKENDNWLANNFGWAFGLILSVTLGFRTSGSHTNPAVSLFFYTAGEISLLRLFLYVIAQTCGAFCGAAITFLEYHDAIQQYGNGQLSVVGLGATAGIFATYPAHYLSITGGCIDQVVGTFVLVFFVVCITDKRQQFPTSAQPIMIGCLLTLIGISLGMNSGYAINPARDLGPRLFTLAVGYGHETFSQLHYVWWLIPIVCPCIGGLLGGWSYKLMALLILEGEDDGDFLENQVSKKLTSSNLTSVQEDAPRI